MKIYRFAVDDLGFVYELVDGDRHEDTYVRLHYKLIGHRNKLERLNLDELVEI